MHAERRQRYLSAMGPGVALFPAAPIAIRNNDVEHDYRQDSDFHYLTGFEEPEALLLLTNQHAEHRAVLFLRPRDPERESWDGPRVGVERAVAELGVDAAYPIAELPERLGDYLGDVVRVHLQLGAQPALDSAVLAAIAAIRRRHRSGVRPPSEIVDPTVLSHEMRLRKAGVEIETMRRAARVTREAHIAAMRFARPGRYEYEVEAELLRTFVAHGSPRVAYASIVGSGPNATILHYRENRRRMEEGDLVLIDAGCELDYYASDVTRTFPISGRFEEGQRELYALVLEAQHAAIEVIRPGATMDTVHDAAVRVLAKGMVELGMIDGPVDDAIEKERYKAYYLHRTSHYLGMDVHDVGSYFLDGKPRPFEPGFVLTVEPGIYVASDAKVEPRHRGVGIRIEDDVVVTESGFENLSVGVPKSIAEIESLLAAR